MKEEKSILRKDVHPFVQGGLIITALLLLNLIAFSMRSGSDESASMLAWEVSLTLVLFFAFGNSIFFLNAKEKGKYWSYSISTYIVVCAIAIFLATSISGVGLRDSSSIKWIVSIFSFSYLIFISIIGMMRKIVEIAIKQDKRLRGEK